MDDRLINDFKSWNNSHHRNDIENNGCAVWNVILTDLPFFEGKQPRISVVFSRYQSNQVNETVLMGDDNHAIGYVLAIPSYWLDVDSYLVISYLSNYIDDFINKYFGNSGGGGCECPNTPPCHPPHHHHPPFCPTPVPPCPNGDVEFNEHISPVGPPIMSPQRPFDPNVQNFNKS